MTQHINIDEYDKCNHDWRSHGSMEKFVVCDKCNSGTDVETLLLEQRLYLYDLILEIIGEDDTPESLGLQGVSYLEGNEPPIPKPVKTRNKLRTEQRQKLKRRI